MAEARMLAASHNAEQNAEPFFKLFVARPVLRDLDLCEFGHPFSRSSPPTKTIGAGAVIFRIANGRC